MWQLLLDVLIAMMAVLAALFLISLFVGRNKDDI